MALGTASSDILRLVIGKGLLLVGIGAVIGPAMEFAVERSFKSALFDAGEVDFLAYVVVPSLFLVTTLAAYCLHGEHPVFRQHVHCATSSVVGPLYIAHPT